jgi:hypothetical protein
MDEETPPGSDPRLVGRLAVDWLFGHRYGPDFFDSAIAAVRESFPSGVQVAAFAPLGLSGEAADFFMLVEGRPDSDDDWEQLVAAHRVLLAHIERVAPPGGTTRSQDFSHFHLAIDSHPPAPVPVEQAAEKWLRS